MLLKLALGWIDANADNLTRPIWLSASATLFSIRTLYLLSWAGDWANDRIYDCN